MAPFTRFMIGTILGIALICVTAAESFCPFALKCAPYYSTETGFGDCSNPDADDSLTSDGNDGNSSSILFYLDQFAADLPFNVEQRTLIPINGRVLEKSFSRVTADLFFLRSTRFAFDHLSHRLGQALFCPNPPLCEPLYLTKSVFLI